MPVIKVTLSTAWSSGVADVDSVPLLDPIPVSFSDVSAIENIQVLGKTQVSIEVDWENPPAEVDYFRLTHTNPAGQEEELNVQPSQEARTKHTIVGKCWNSNLARHAEKLVNLTKNP